MRLVALCAIAGCGAPPAPVPEAPRPLDDILGHTVAPPEPLARLHVGMTVAEMRAAVPDATETRRHGYRLPFDGGDVEQYARIDAGRVVHLDVLIPGGDALARIVDAWGEPDRGHDAPTWHDAASGWRASAVCSEAAQQPPYCLLQFNR